MFLKSKNITVVRKGGSTLQFPDIEVGHDDSVLLLGASGAGKTTFLSVLAGLLRPNAGQVLVDGGDFYAISCRPVFGYRGACGRKSCEV